MVTTGYFGHYATKTFVTLNLTSNDIGQELIVVFQDGDTGLITGCLKC
ncbi:Uncharacterised protein [Streptococcus pneumoniae]|nr:Uncharacterised protein [Streptococcus pneumoniae]CKX45753.1 Uncharacterised protein [Mycobacterium tuberculosis]